jgi:hypothetical protein
MREMAWNVDENMSMDEKLENYYLYGRERIIK